MRKKIRAKSIFLLTLIGALLFSYSNATAANLGNKYESAMYVYGGGLDKGQSNCPANHVVVAIAFQHNPMGNGFMCSELKPDGTLEALSDSVRFGAISYVFCPEGMAATGYNFSNPDGQKLEIYAGLVCKKPIDVLSASEKSTQLISGYKKVNISSSYAIDFRSHCSNGDFMVGQHVWSDQWFDKLAAVCAQFTNSILVYDLNGGDGDLPAPQYLDHGTSIALINVANPTRDKFEFQGWAIDQEATDNFYHSGDQIKVTGKTILYAQWKMLPVKESPSPSPSPSETPVVIATPDPCIANNSCQFEPIATLDELNQIKDQDALPNYDPLQEPDKTTGTLLVGIAALTMLGVNNPERNDKEKKDEDTSVEKEDLSSLNSGELLSISRESRWGDTSKTWQHRRTDTFVGFFIGLSQKAGLRSPLSARILADGSYLRAIFGVRSIALYPIALLLGIYLTFSIDFQVMPPVWTIMAAVLLLSALDAFAGAIVALIYMFAAIVTGHVVHRSEIMTVLGVAIFMLSPALIASAVRPFRRVFEGTDKWERLVDYSLVVLLTGWSINGAVGSLNSLAHKQFALSFYSAKLAVVASISVLLRLILEDVATHLYPKRLELSTPKKSEQLKSFSIMSKLWPIFIFLVITSRVIGWNEKLAIGTLIFFAPKIFKLLGGKISHRSVFWHWLTPNGAFKIIAMIFIGGLFADWAKSIMPKPEDFVTWSFALMAIPGLVINIFAMLSKEPENDWKVHSIGKWFYRVGGVAIFIALIAMVKGVDLLAWFKSLI